MTYSYDSLLETSQAKSEYNNKRQQKVARRFLIDFTMDFFSALWLLKVTKIQSVLSFLSFTYKMANKNWPYILLQRQFVDAFFLNNDEHEITLWTLETCKSLNLELSCNLNHPENFHMSNLFFLS